MTNAVARALRSGAQILVGVIASFLLARGVELSPEASAALFVLVMAVGTWLYGVVVHFLETRTGKAWQVLARVLMLGAGAKQPVYVAPETAERAREAGR